MLGEYTFTVEHVAGKDHVNADFFSRKPENDWAVDIFKNQRTIMYAAEEVNMAEVKTWKEEVQKSLKFEETQEKR